jgi:hypothetical protein
MLLMTILGLVVLVELFLLVLLLRSVQVEHVLQERLLLTDSTEHRWLARIRA